MHDWWLMGLWLRLWLWPGLGNGHKARSQIVVLVINQGFLISASRVESSWVELSFQCWQAVKRRRAQSLHNNKNHRQKPLNDWRQGAATAATLHPATSPVFPWLFPTPVPPAPLTSPHSIYNIFHFNCGAVDCIRFDWFHLPARRLAVIKIHCIVFTRATLDDSLLYFLSGLCVCVDSDLLSNQLGASVCGNKTCSELATSVSFHFPHNTTRLRRCRCRCRCLAAFFIIVTQTLFGNNASPFPRPRGRIYAYLSIIIFVYCPQKLPVNGSTMTIPMATVGAAKNA